MKTDSSMVISMRLPTKSGQRLRRMASRHGWTPSDASARLVEEGLRRSEFAFIDFRDSAAGRQACIQGSSLAVWEVMMLARDYKAAAQKLTLVTYDRKTIPPLLKAWAEADRDHGGVVFVDNKTIPSSDFGGLIRALQKLLQEAARWDWTNRICFLRR